MQADNKLVIVLVMFEGVYSFLVQSLSQYRIKNASVRTVYKPSKCVWLLTQIWVLNHRKKAAKIKSAYKQDYFHTTADIDFDFAGPTVQASAVVG